MLNENENGEVQGSTEAPTEVKAEQNNDAQNVENNEQNNQEQLTEPQVEETVVADPIVVEMDADEKILNDIFESGKTEVTTSDLITAGFDTSRMSQYSFEVGKFKLTRLLLVSPYKIEKITA